jgi:exonuclease III
VYGPSTQVDKEIFYRQFENCVPINTPCLIFGDFNVTLHENDRSNPVNHWRNTNRFAEVIRAMSLHNLNLQGRRYIWSNARDRPTFVRLD